MRSSSAAGRMRRTVVLQGPRAPPCSSSREYRPPCRCGPRGRTSPSGQPVDLPFQCRWFPRVPEVSRPRRAEVVLALARHPVLPSAFLHSVGAPDGNVSRLNVPPRVPLSTLRRWPHDRPHMTQGQVFAVKSLRSAISRPPRGGVRGGGPRAGARHRGRGAPGGLPAHDQLLRPRMVGVAKGGDGPPPEDSDLARILQFGEAGQRTSQRPGRVGQGANHVVAGALQPTSCTVRSAGSENMGQRM